MSEDTAAVVQRQATNSFNRAFQNMFNVVGEVVALYRHKQSVDGGSALEDVGLVEENMQAYKTCFDSTGPDIHVDTVLELYTKVRNSVLRGYQCDSWLRDKTAVLYYGVSVSEAGMRILDLRGVFLMLECLKRADSQSRSQAAVLRVKFANQIYTIFMSALRYVKVVENEVNVRGVTPEQSLENDLAALEDLQKEILADIPKPAAPAPAGPGMGANPLAGMFSGGLSDVVGSLLQTLPSLTKTVTDTVARTTGTTLSETDQRMIDSTMSNITGLLSNPDGMRSMLSELGNGPEGINRLVERLLTAGAPPPVAAPAIEGPSLD